MKCLRLLLDKYGSHTTVNHAVDDVRIVWAAAPVGDKAKICSMLCDVLCMHFELPLSPSIEPTSVKANLTVKVLSLMGLYKRSGQPCSTI